MMMTIKFTLPGIVMLLVILGSTAVTAQETAASAAETTSVTAESASSVKADTADSEGPAVPVEPKPDVVPPILSDNAGSSASPPATAVSKPVTKSRTMTVELTGPSTGKADQSFASGNGVVPPLVTPKTLNPFIAVGDEMFLGMALITAWGVHFWDWFEEPLHFQREHGFTQQSSTGGADKTGHFYTSYVIADFLNWRLRKQGWSPLRSSLVSASVAMGLMTWIEIGDGTSAYGFSWEDMLADFIGVAISAGLGISPIADDLLDFRLEYWPTSKYMDGGVMAADYSGMKYLMALRMTGIKPLKKTPLRFVEWHLGYYSRGFRSFDKATETNRVVYFGMGIDLKEIIDKFIPKKIKRPFDVMLTYYQVPYTSWPLHKWEHPWTAPSAKPGAGTQTPVEP